MQTKFKIGDRVVANMDIFAINDGRQILSKGRVGTVESHVFATVIRLDTPYRGYHLITLEGSTMDNYHASRMSFFDHHNEVVDMTMAEICKALGKNVRVKK